MGLACFNGRTAVEVMCRISPRVAPRMMPMLDRLRRIHTLQTIGMRYGVVIYWSKADSNFLVEVPELPGCMADGATYEVAVANVQLVISEWLKTAGALSRPISSPKGKLVFSES